MKSTFNAIMRIVSTLLGLLLAALGTVWVLQGLGLAFLDSFMANDPQWAVYGTLLVLVGLCQALWSNTRTT